MVLPAAEVLCTLSLVANSLRDGLCCCYQMHHDSQKHQDTEQLVRRAVRDELRSFSYNDDNEDYDNDDEIDEDEHREPTKPTQPFVVDTNLPSSTRSSSSIANGYELVRVQKVDAIDCQQPKQTHSRSSLLPPIPAVSSLLDDDDDVEDNTTNSSTQWTGTRDTSFVTIGIE